MKLLQFFPNRRHSIHRATSNKNKPLSYEELLDKPFYTVEGESGDNADSGGVGDLAAAVDYRTMMQHMLFDIRIESPSRLRNWTLADRIASMEWAEEAVSRAVQDKVSCALLIGKDVRLSKRFCNNSSESSPLACLGQATGQLQFGSHTCLRNQSENT